MGKIDWAYLQKLPAWQRKLEMKRIAKELEEEKEREKEMKHKKVNYWEEPDV